MENVKSLPSGIVPRKVLRESFDTPLELDEQDHNAPENELDEDDHIYKEAIPPAPKLQGATPRTNISSATTIDNTFPFDSVPTPNRTDKMAIGQYQLFWTQMRI